MNYKNVTWSITDAMMPFGMLLSAWKTKDGMYRWSVGRADSEYTYKKGKCSTEESARKNAEKAYYEYVDKNMKELEE